MSEIPEAIAVAGLKLWIEALEDGTPDAGLVIIARALLTERQRCASIALRRHPHDSKLSLWSQGRRIAEAIMEPST